MPTLVPVDGDPFASSGAASAPKLTPVDHDPFAEKKSSPFSFLGLLKSAGSGVVRGLESGASALGQAAAIEQTGGTDGVPDAQQTQDILDKNVTGPMYTPQNTAERIVHAGGAAIGANPPLAAMTGPLGTFGAGAASEAAHEAAKDTPLDLPAQLVAPILLGKAVNMGRNAVNGVVSKATGKTANVAQEDLENAAGANYDKFRGSPIEYSGNTLADFTTPALASHAADGWDDLTAPRTTAMLERLGQPTNGTITPARLYSARRSLEKLTRNVSDPEDAQAARNALDAFDDHIENVSANPRYITSGTPQEAQDALKAWQDARGDYGAAKRMERWSDAMDDAKLKAGTNNSGMNVGTDMRKASNSFLTGKAKPARGMNDDETNAIRSFSQAGPALNSVRLASNMMGGGGGIGGAIEGLMGAHVNPMLAGIPLVGMGLRKLYNNRVASQADYITQLLAQRSPLAQSMGSTPGIQNLLGTSRAMQLAERIMRAARGPEGVWASGQ